MPNEQTTAKHVLVVDDEPDFADLLKSILAGAGYEVTVAHNSDQALDSARQCKPDLITLDIHMPRKSGVFFFRKLTEDEAFRDVPVVVVTGLTRDGEMQNLIRRLLDAEDLPSPRAYLEKPIEREHFLETIRQMLESSKSA
ncbi:MAG: response regulator [Planctomycetes bacterium]|nr:response regulator [Planctomycetota bacterium]MBL7041897.1 response regulator [Pirellulaceae bacterium]